MAEKYGSHERAALFVLLLADDEINNRDLKDRHGITLSKDGREKLNKARLLDTDTDKRPYVHRITEAGRAWCEQALTEIEPPPRPNPLVRAGFELLRFFARYAQEHKIPLAAVIGTVPGLESLIRKAYRDLSDRPGEHVRLAQLRPKLNGADKDEVDQMLVEMLKTGLVDLAPDSDRRGLTDADRAAAIRIGMEDKHFVAIEES
ncbi:MULTISPECIES: hypothetical protein [Amycolatopsis]|uniref:MarR family transcriptional regulator n=1 Tax=Amycolatopsis bullii TaxID=941987 RepID=A0ABQ3K0B1_9PSEU|nr:hypothetical protein [Amycolatopsis bullii]GHF98297.1 hypothetical protein GCM10017567_11200 [Amycolatopsis bullii]